MTEGESVQEPICQNSEGTIIKLTIFPNQGDILLDFLVCLHIKIYSLLKKAHLKFLKFCQALKHASVTAWERSSDVSSELLLPAALPASRLVPIDLNFTLAFQEAEGRQS